MILDVVLDVVVLFLISSFFFSFFFSDPITHLKWPNTRTNMKHWNKERLFFFFSHYYHFVHNIKCFMIINNN